MRFYARRANTDGKSTGALIISTIMDPNDCTKEEYDAAAHVDICQPWWETLGIPEIPIGDSTVYELNVTVDVLYKHQKKWRTEPLNIDPGFTCHSCKNRTEKGRQFCPFCGIRL